MKILLFGKNGQLGSEFQHLLYNLEKNRFLGREELDLCNINALQHELNEFKPNLIINASAYNAVDKAESDGKTVMKVNAIAPGVMAEWARKFQAVFIHFSTDYVFDGKKNLPYMESDFTNPLNVYGKSKLVGEQNIEQTGGAYLILRTSWVYSAQKSSSFLNKVLKWARNNETLKIVNDQVSNPTLARDLAWATYRVLMKNQANLLDVMRERRGIYHIAGAGYTSRYEWAKHILAYDPNRTEQRVRAIEPVFSEEFPTPAIRPRFSALACSKFEGTFKIKLPSWEEALREYLAG